jgi:hypothetical protein
MKTLVSIFALCCLLSAKSFSQKLTNNYLMGTWNIEDTTHHLPSMSLVFEDSVHVKLVIPDEGSVSLTYSLTMYHNQVAVQFKGVNVANKKMHMYWFIKILDDKTMEAEEPLYSPQTYKWNDSVAIPMVKQQDNTVAMH